MTGSGNDGKTLGRGLFSGIASCRTGLFGVWLSSGRVTLSEEKLKSAEKLVVSFREEIMALVQIKRVKLPICTSQT